MLRGVSLPDKPPEMLKISSKVTVPNMLLPGGGIIQESREIMHWVLGKKDPEGWLCNRCTMTAIMSKLSAETDGSFKENPGRYKYANRYEVPDPNYNRNMGTTFLEKLNRLLGKSAYLCGNSFTFADAAIVPFIR